MRAFGILLLLWLPLSSWVLYVFAAWMGLFWLGTVPLTQGLIGQIYGLRYAATLSGIVFLGHQLGSFVGVWLGGYAYAKTGNYDMVWWLGVVLAVLARCCACQCASSRWRSPPPPDAHPRPGRSWNPI